MPLTINSNQPASISQRALTESNRALERSLAKLSSGQRVESARDDAASLAIGSRLLSQIGSLRVYQQNASQVIAKLQIAEGAYQRVDDMLVRMRALSAQAQSSNLSATERGMLDTEFQQLKSEITRMSQSTTFNGSRLFATGAISFNTTAISATSAAAFVGQSYAADFNNDGFVDILNGEATNVSLSLSNGGTSLNTITTISGSSSSRLAIGDFNGDGNMDFVRAANFAASWEVYAGDGRGAALACMHLAVSVPVTSAA